MGGYMEGTENISTLNPVVDDSSEIASFRFSSSYRKSMKNTKLKCRNQYIGGKKNVSLSKISEENSDNSPSSNTTKVENKVNSCNVIPTSNLSYATNDDFGCKGK